VQEIQFLPTYSLILVLNSEMEKVVRGQLPGPGHGIAMVSRLEMPHPRLHPPLTVEMEVMEDGPVLGLLHGALSLLLITSTVAIHLTEVP